MRVSIKKAFLLGCGTLTVIIFSFINTDFTGSETRRKARLTSRRNGFEDHRPTDEGLLSGKERMLRDRESAMLRIPPSSHRLGETLVAESIGGRSKLNNGVDTRLADMKNSEEDADFYEQKLTDNEGKKTSGSSDALKAKEVGHTSQFNRDKNEKNTVRDKGEALRLQNIKIYNRYVRQHDTKQYRQLELSPVHVEKSDRPENKEVDAPNDILQRPLDRRSVRVLGKSARDKWQPRLHQQDIANNFAMSEDELQTLLISELQATHTAVVKALPETEVASRLTSVGKTILIIGYHRTGSTLLGTIFHRNPGTFFLFEPLHMLDVSREFVLLNGTVILNTSRTYPMVEALVLRSLLSCEFHKLPVEVLMDNHHVVFRDSMEHAVYCMRRLRSQMTNTSGFQYLWQNLTSRKMLTARCLDPIKEACYKAPVRVYKFIRLRMPGVKNILRDTRDVKVVHLLRDPRGNVLSQGRLLIQNPPRSSAHIKLNIVVKKKYFKQFISITNGYCKDVRNDMAWKQDHASQYEGRIATVQYEKFAMSPLEVSKRLYKFADLTFPTETEDFLWHSTSSGQTRMCAYCVDRGNSTSSAFSWRKVISPTQLKIVDELCEDIYGKMGLKLLQDITDVRNTDIDIVV